MIPESALYAGRLRHRRFRPRPHEFEYSVWMAFLDIDRIPELCRASRLLSYNRWNAATFDERDHTGDPALPLRERLRIDAAEAGVAFPDGPIFLLTNLRNFGYCFNPVSYYYGYDAAGKLATMLAEVNNTWGERHNYWMEAATAAPGGERHAWAFPKEFHVSPFMSMNCRYRFAFTDPAERLTVQVNEWEDEEFTFDSTLRLEKETWCARELRRRLLRQPFMSLKVISAIHWEALRLWLKRVPVFTHPKKLRDRQPV